MMVSITFEQITEETLYIALEMVNSNPDYNLLADNKRVRHLDEVRSEFLNLKTESMFIKLDDTYIGLIDYISVHPKDHCTWLGLLLIHGDYQGYGFGSRAYDLFENQLLNTQSNLVRIGILKGNDKAKTFWEAKGFTFFKTELDQHKKEVACFEKKLQP